MRPRNGTALVPEADVARSSDLDVLITPTIKESRRLHILQSKLEVSRGTPFVEGGDGEW